MEFFTGTGKMKKFFLTTRDVLQTFITKKKLKNLP